MYRKYLVLVCVSVAHCWLMFVSARRIRDTPALKSPLSLFHDGEPLLLYFFALFYWWKTQEDTSLSLCWAGPPAIFIWKLTSSRERPSRTGSNSFAPTEARRLQTTVPTSMFRDSLWSGTRQTHVGTTSPGVDRKRNRHFGMRYLFIDSHCTHLITTVACSVRLYLLKKKILHASDK